MNGYTLANAFRTLRESWRFTSTEADLYYELVGIANERSWPTSFQYSNQLLCATIGISEKSLIAARNRLKQAGLLDFVSGHKRAPTAYTLSQKGLPQVSKKGSKSDSVNGSESDSPLYKELKQKENELQLKLSEQRRAADAARVEAEKKMAALFAEVEQLKAQPKEVSAPPVAAAPPPRRPAKVAAKLLMRDSPLVDFAAFSQAWTEAVAANPGTYTDFTTADLKHYHAALLDWSDANAEKKADWLATIRGSMRRDADKNNLRRLNQPPAHHANRPATTQQPTQRYNTTARGGFGGFAGPAPGGRATQPVGGIATGNPSSGASDPTKRTP